MCKSIINAANALRDSNVVAIPTETVYGLGALCDDDQAVQHIFTLKGRPTNNPLIIHVSDIEQARLYGLFNDQATQLAEKFWPGPLTIVVPINSDANISKYVTAGLGTIAIRCPAHTRFQKLIRKVDTPIAAPSANISGYVSPTKYEHVYSEFGDKIMILEGDQSVIGLESTIVDCSADQLKVLRPGGVTKADIESTLNQPVEIQNTVKHGAIKAPGQLKHHYSPRASVRLNATSAELDEAVLNFGPTPLNGTFTLNLSPTASLHEAATNLFDFLRQLDDLGYSKIAVAPIPDHGIGVAINERLSRAATRT